ncbi:RHS repeat-associated core domain-containing protein [Pseudomonas sp. C1C7]|uniref:RHS repeat-associated core domain-containing protein n=1 Tax=Pseudomonas sp. C1C7 TaxID=2735272 RepID=UPI00273DF471|nr:RHS repeat-associated core domain-containing protein [Pseudomonas sp. C1C7]
MPTRSSKTILLGTDLQNSVLNVLDTNRAHAIAYTPYGHRSLGGLLSLLGFNGELPDPLTGHYHLGKGYRQFNSVLMRFNSPDSWSPFGKGGLNVYGYCAGDPVNSIDPTGHTFEFLKFFLRKAGLMEPASTKKTLQNLALAQTNTKQNIDEIFTSGKTPRGAYLAQLKAEKHRKTHAAVLSHNPELAGSRANTLTTFEAKEMNAAKKQYRDEVMKNVSSTSPSPLIERNQKYTFSEAPPVITLVERLVPVPADGWRTVESIRQPTRRSQ